MDRNRGGIQKRDGAPHGTPYSQDEKAAKRRAEKKAQLEKLTEDETFTISATGTDVKSVTQNLLAAVSGTSAPTGASFDIKA